MSKALHLLGDTTTEETAKFVEMFDKFFDTLNVSNFSSGKEKRKPFQSPYISGTDFRLKVIKSYSAHSINIMQTIITVVGR